MASIRHRFEAAAAVWAGLLAAPHSVASPVDCAAGERTLFACGTGSKTVAVCASARLTRTEGSVQYRFGSATAVELAYPAEGADWRGVARGGVLMFSAGGGSFLAFSNREYRYIVYSAVGQGWGKKSGVAVERSGRRIASLACRTATTSIIGPDLFAEAGIAASDEDFELP